jgi:hypothetical protein
MSVTLDGIVFDHAIGAANDALSIRKNQTTAATSDIVAYALAPTADQPLTIQAAFRIELPPGTTLMIRTRLAAGSSAALGEVQAKAVAVPAAGKGTTGPLLFDLTGARMWAGGVDIHAVIWSWQFQLNGSGPWTEFARTAHTVYTILDMPNMPWGQPAVESSFPAWPWADVLDWSCRWAKGSRSPIDAATQIVRGIWELGERADNRVAYSAMAVYVTSATHVFRCTSFLKLLNGHPDRQPLMNCTDCATAVVTFANILGCNLAQVSLDPPGARQLRLNPIRLIGLVPPGPKPEPFGPEGGSPESFSYHEIAWHSPDQTVNGRTGYVFDATLQIDGNGNPHTFPFGWIAAAARPFMKHRPPVPPALGYRDRLVIPRDRPVCVPVMQPYRRIDSGHGTPPAVEGVRARLRQVYLNIMSGVADSATALLEFDPNRPVEFDGFRLYEISQPADFFAELEALTVASVEWFYQAIDDPGVKVSIALAQTRRAADARDVLAWSLTDCATEVQPLVLPDADRVGDIAFLAPQDRALYFVRANMAARLIRIGPAPLAPMARRADAMLTALLRQLIKSS